MKLLTASAAFISLVVTTAQAQATSETKVTLIATGTVVQFEGYPAGSFNGHQLKVGDTMQFEYTVDPSIPFSANGGPIVSFLYSFNGAPFTDFYGNEFLDVVKASAGRSYSFGLQPSHGEEAYLNVSLGKGAPAGIVPSSNLNVVPNWKLAAAAPPGSVVATMFIEDLFDDGAEANITDFEQVGGPGGTGTASAPEIDPGGLASGLALLLGSLAVFSPKRTGSPFLK